MKLNIIFLFVLLTFIGCQKDVDEFQPYVQTAISFPEILELTPIYKQFDANVDSKVDLGQGETLFFPAHTMVDGKGEILSGKVDLEITRIAKKSDLIYTFMNSNVASTQLNNYHIINIKAYANTQKAFIKSGRQITLKAPTNQVVDAGSVWVGNFDKPNSFEWNALGINTITPTSWEINGETFSGISYQSGKMGWVSGGKASSGAIHQLCVNLVEGLKFDHTKVYFIFDDQFTVAELKEYSDTKQFCADIPDGTKGHLIIINEEESGKYRFQNKAMTITENTTFSAQPQITVLENIVSTLNGF